MIPVILRGYAFGIAAIASIIVLPHRVCAEAALDVVVPGGVDVSALYQPDQPAPKNLPANAAFDVDPDGLPAIAAGTSLKLLGSSEELFNLGVLPIDDFAWMRDGRMLLVTENHLASLSPKGIALGPALPGAGMRVRPAGDNTAYVFGGTSEPANHNIYLFARDSTTTKLAILPSPVVAVAGDGMTTYVATDKAVLRIAFSEPARVLLETHEPIVSLEIAPRQGLFYATKASVGYIDSNGKAADFIRGEGGQLRLRGSTLFVLTTHGDLLRFGPADAFERANN